MRKFLLTMIVVAAATAVQSAQASGLHELLLDTNSITAQAVDVENQPVAFDGVTHTGAIVFGMDGDSGISLWLEGVRATAFDGAALVGLDGRIDLQSGIIAGGYMDIAVRGADQTLDTYRYDVVAESGLVWRPASPLSFTLLGYQVRGESTNGVFSDDHFGGANISVWQHKQPLDGAFLTFKYSPNAAGFQSNTDIDIVSSVAAPTPSAAYAGMAILGALGAIRAIRRARKA